MQADPPRQRKAKWTRQDDEALIRAVALIGPHKWSSIALFVPGRTGKQCRERWLGHLSPTVIKSDWTTQEDAALLHWHKMYGNQWTVISRLMPGRTSCAVKNRWNVLNRKLLSLNQSQTPSESNEKPDPEPNQVTEKVTDALFDDVEWNFDIQSL